MNKLPKNKRNGISLVEIILAIALIGILMIGFLTIFSTGYAYIMNAGRHTQQGYEAQSEMEDHRESHNSVGTDFLSLNFSGYGNITITGTVLEVDLVDSGRTITVHSFIPNE